MGVVMRVVRLDLSTSETSALLVKSDASSISFNTFLTFFIASLFSLRLAIYLLSFSTRPQYLAR